MFTDTRVPVPNAGLAAVLIVWTVNVLTEFVRFSPAVNRIGVVAPAVPEDVFVYLT